MCISASIIFGFTEIKCQLFRAQILHTLVLQKMCFRSGSGDLDSAWMWFRVEQHLWMPEENKAQLCHKAREPWSTWELNFVLQFKYVNRCLRLEQTACLLNSESMLRCSSAALCLVSCKAELYMAWDNGTEISYGSERCWIFSLENKHFVNMRKITTWAFF